MENELCATLHLSIRAYTTNLKTLEMPLELVLEVRFNINQFFSVFVETWNFSL